MKRKTKTKVKIPPRGLFWHVHHEYLVEGCWSYRERKSFIKNDKSSTEVDLRLELFKPVTLEGATGRVKKFIRAAWKNADPSHLDIVAKKLGFRPNNDHGYSRSHYWAALLQVAKLHNRQCHPQCPVRSSHYPMRTLNCSNILRYRDAYGKYTLKPNK